ncbi:MAG: hypothetical protein RLZZ419_1985 [Pseudomonadota bacterium]
MKKGCELLALSAILLFWIDDKLLAEVKNFDDFYQAFSGNDL